MAQGTEGREGTAEDSASAARSRSRGAVGAPGACGQQGPRTAPALPHLARVCGLPPGERPFPCTLCEKAFNQKSALQVHVKKHTGERPYRCEHCAMGFTQKSNMKLHVKRAHSYAGERGPRPGGGAPRVPSHQHPAAHALGGPVVRRRVLVSGGRPQAGQSCARRAEREPPEDRALCPRQTGGVPEARASLAQLVG